MKSNDAYMIPSYDFGYGEAVAGTEKECLTAKGLYRKQWRATIHKQQEKATVQTLGKLTQQQRGLQDGF